MSAYEGIARRTIFGAKVRSYRKKGRRSGARGTPLAPLKYGEYMFPGRRTWVEADQYRPPIEELKREIKMTEHYVKLQDLLDKYETDSVKGLKSKTATAYLEIYGANTLTAVVKTSKMKRFAIHLISGFSLLLWVGAILCFVSAILNAYSFNRIEMTGNIYLGCILIITIVWSALISYYYEAESARILGSFRELMPMFTKVIRDGVEQKIPVDQLVVGDLVVIKPGDRIPADIRIIEAKNMKVNNSNVTGESDLKWRKAECTDANPFETQNLAFFSTYCVEGYGRGIVIATGNGTVLGRMASLVSALQITETPISLEIRSFVRIVTFIAIVMGIIALVICLVIGYDWLQSIVFLICLIVANVPMGLLAALTACLALSAQCMASKNCLVKDLEAVETLGTTSTICSDKTGTLTENRMTVSHVWYDNTMFEVWNQTKGYCDLLNLDQESECWGPLSRCARLCSRTEFMSNQENVRILNRKCFGDASEAAILKFMEEIIGDVMEYRSRFPKICEIPFNSTDKFHVTIHRQDDASSPHILCMKGAPERVLEKCSTVLTNGQELELDDLTLNRVRRAYRCLGFAGERVIGFCDYLLPQDCFGPDYRFDSEEINFPLSGFRFLGLMGMEDPPRAGVRGAVQKCREAGIKVIMVTGDHPTTAEAIAREVGIVTGQKPITADNVSLSSCESYQHAENEYAVVVGENLRTMSDKELDYILYHYDEIIFARTSPQQKLHIVEGCQRIGESVAVTGDGVNDSPALRQADIGVAMGIGGSDVSKDASDIILLDDNFASIVTGVEEGRLIFDNLKKCIAFTLTKTMPEVLPFLAHVVIGIPLPLAPIKILFIDLMTTIPAVSLSYERAEIDVMKRKPMDRKLDKVVNCGLLLKAYFRAGIIQTLGAFFAYLVVMAQSGFKPIDLVGLRKEWNSEAINDLRDSYGQEWTYHDRKELERTCYTVYFVAVVILQCANVVCCKTRINSITQQGMRNVMMNFSILLIIVLCIAFIYVPGLNTVLQFKPIHWTWWFPALPFALLMLSLDEIRRYVLRSVYPSRTSWAWKELYW